MTCSLHPLEQFAIFVQKCSEFLTAVCENLCRFDNRVDLPVKPRGHGQSSALVFREDGLRHGYKYRNQRCVRQSMNQVLVHACGRPIQEMLWARGGPRCSDAQSVGFKSSCLVEPSILSSKHLIGDHRSYRCSTESVERSSRPEQLITLGLSDLLLSKKVRLLCVVPGSDSNRPRTGRGGKRNQHILVEYNARRFLGPKNHCTSEDSHAKRQDQGYERVCGIPVLRFFLLLTVFHGVWNLRMEGRA